MTNTRTFYIEDTKVSLVETDNHLVILSPMGPDRLGSFSREGYTLKWFSNPDLSREALSSAFLTRYWSYVDAIAELSEDIAQGRVSGDKDVKCVFDIMKKLRFRTLEEDSLMDALIDAGLLSKEVPASVIVTRIRAPGYDYVETYVDLLVTIHKAFCNQDNSCTQ